MRWIFGLREMSRFRWKVEVQIKRREQGEAGEIESTIGVVIEFRM